MVLHIRRDEKEYSFLEHLIKWASSLKGFSFVQDSKNVDITGKIENLETLSVVPTVLGEKEMDDNLINTVIEEFNSIGYQVEGIKADVKLGLPLNIKVLTLKEKGIRWWIDQSELSDGMFRALALLIIVNYLISKGIKTKQLSYKGYGCSNPIADNNTDNGRQFNRRVEFKVLRNK